MQLKMYIKKLYIYMYIKTHCSELRGQGGSTSRRTHVSILQEQTLLK